MDTAQFPAGWYSDPGARHEQRYWDGESWTERIADHGVPGVDPPGPIVAFGVAMGAGYQAVAVATWRRVMVGLAAFALVLVFVFEILATVMALGTRTTSYDESWLWMWGWLYQPVEFTFRGNTLSGQMFIGLPPLLLLLALPTALVFLTRRERRLAAVIACLA